MRTVLQRSSRWNRYVWHSLVILAAMTFMLLNLAAGRAHGAQTTLSWNPPVTTDGTAFTGFSGYKLYLGSSSRNYSQTIDVGSVTTYLLNNLSDGATYYFAVSDYDGVGNESAYSNEVSKTFPFVYTLTATSGLGGAITPVGAVPSSTATNGSYTITSVSVTQGATQSFSLAAMPGYTIASVTVDGVSVGAVSSYTFANVTANHTIAATFSVIPVRVNVALQTNGGVATASSTYSANYPVAALNNGDRKGVKWGAGGGWNDATSGVYPDWAQITFNGQKSITEINVFTLQDAYTAPVEPTQSLIFKRYGITTFDIQAWNGTSWVTVPGGSIAGNNLIWRKITFPAISTDRIRVVINGSLSSYSRITEIEAY